MKKITILIVAIIFGTASGFAQVYTLYVHWDSGNCDCLGGTAENNFKVTYSIYDDANDEYVILNKTVYTADATLDYKNIQVPEVETYCGQLHEYPPSLIASADVWLIENYTNPPTVCCSGSGEDDPRTCQYYYDNIVNVDAGDLN